MILGRLECAIPSTLVCQSNLRVGVSCTRGDFLPLVFPLPLYQAFYWYPSQRSRLNSRLSPHWWIGVSFYAKISTFHHHYQHNLEMTSNTNKCYSTLKSELCDLYHTTSYPNTQNLIHLYLFVMKENYRHEVEALLYFTGCHSGVVQPLLKTRQTHITIVLQQLHSKWVHYMK